MARSLPSKRTKRQQMVINAAFDFYGEGGIKANIRSAKKIALSIMGRKARLNPLTPEERKDERAIKTNLADATYIKSFIDNPPKGLLLG